MKTNRYLLPRYFKVIGWIISVPSALVSLIYLFTGQVINGVFSKSHTEDVVNSIIITICLVLLMLGLLFIAFSKEKMEDEYITKVRGDSLIWAVIANAIFMIILSSTVYGIGFLYVSFFNLYTVLVLFIIKFNLALSNLKKQSGNEEQFKS